MILWLGYLEKGSLKLEDICFVFSLVYGHEYTLVVSV